MTKNCLLVTPNEFLFFCPGKAPTKEGRCSGSGSQRVLFELTVPSGSDTAVVEIGLVNLRTEQKETYFIYTDQKCSCSPNCIIDQGIKFYNQYSISLNIDNLMPGEHYSGIACLNYIDSSTGV